MLTFPLSLFAIEIRTDYIAFPRQEAIFQLRHLRGFRTVGQVNALIVITVMILLVLSGFKFLAGDALGQTEILNFDESKTKSLPHQVNVTINNVKLQADVALTPDEQTKGLAIKDTLKSNEGMLFPYDKPRILSFWMKDMKFPIDILWLNADKRVAHIEESLQPCSPLLPCLSYAPDVQAQYVLETVAGFSSSHGITEGTPVEFELSQ
jgi:uncharacterized protein